MKINLLHTSYEQQFGRSWDEVYDLLYFSLQDLGHHVERCVGKTLPSPADLNIIIGWNACNSWRSLDPKKTIVVQLENLASGVLARHKEQIGDIMSEYMVWDYSHSNFSLYPTDTKLHHLQLGYHSCLDFFSPRRSPDHEVAFYGSLTPRRKDILDKLDKWHDITAMGNVWGGKTDQFLANSKLVLNIGANPERPIESPRLAYCLNNGVLVVSEEGSSPMDNEYWSQFAVVVPEQMLSHNIYEVLEDSVFKDKRHELTTKYQEDTCMTINVEKLLEETL